MACGHSKQRSRVAVEEWCLVVVVFFTCSVIRATTEAAAGGVYQVCTYTSGFFANNGDDRGGVSG